jgi:PTS system nitrogen regulatory IIA component
MRLSDLISPKDVVSRMRVSTKTHLLKEIARRASAMVNFDESVIHKALTDREQLGSTGVGGGIALPHARLPGLTRIVGMMVSLERPIDFQSIDELPVDLVGMLLVPDDAKSEAKSALACLARRFREPGVADRLRKSKAADELYKYLTAEAGC